MKYLKKRIGFLIIITSLFFSIIGVMSVHGVSTFEGTVEDCSGNPLSGATIVLTDRYYNILDTDTTDSSVITTLVSH